jgi:hypothetical protein
LPVASAQLPVFAVSFLDEGSVLYWQLATGNWHLPFKFIIR